MDEQTSQATPNAILEQRIMDPNFPKNEREHWAAGEIHRLRDIIGGGCAMHPSASLLDRIHAIRDAAKRNGQHELAEWLKAHADEACPAAMAQAMGIPPLGYWARVLDAAIEELHLLSGDNPPRNRSVMPLTVTLATIADLIRQGSVIPAPTPAPDASTDAVREAVFVADIHGKCTVSVCYVRDRLTCEFVRKHMRPILAALADAERKLACGHPAPLLVRSVESNYEYCQLCEARDRLRDALTMERTYAAQLADSEKRAKELADLIFEEYGRKSPLGEIARSLDPFEMLREERRLAHSEASLLAEERLTVESLAAALTRQLATARETAAGVAVGLRAVPDLMAQWAPSVLADVLKTFAENLAAIVAPAAEAAPEPLPYRVCEQILCSAVSGIGTPCDLHRDPPHSRHVGVQNQWTDVLAAEEAHHSDDGPPQGVPSGHPDFKAMRNGQSAAADNQSDVSMTVAELSGMDDLPPHRYLSTACHHGKHSECRKECKFCAAVCGCACHREDYGAEVTPACAWSLCGKPQSASCHQLCCRRMDESRQREFCNDGGCHPFTPEQANAQGSEADDGELLIQEACSNCDDDELRNLTSDRIEYDTNGDALCPKCGHDRIAWSQAIYDNTNSPKGAPSSSPPFTAEEALSRLCVKPYTGPLTGSRSSSRRWKSEQAAKRRHDRGACECERKRAEMSHAE